MQNEAFCGLGQNKSMLEVCNTFLVLQEVERLVADVMRHMLFKNHQQFGVPVRRDELVQLITKTYKTRNLPNHVIQKAQERFKKVLGIDMRELIRSRQAKNAKTSHSSQGWLQFLYGPLAEKYLYEPFRSNLQDFTWLFKI